MSNPQARWIGLAVLLVLGGAGCGGDDDNDSASPGNEFGNADPNETPGDESAAGRGVPGGGCAEGNTNASLARPRVILVVDGSCSMTTPYPANGAMSATRCGNDPNSRWAALRNALVGQNGVVANLQNVVEFGMVVFGTQPQCPLTGAAIEPAAGNFDAINAALGNSPPGMFTPTGPALNYVYDNLVLGEQLDTDSQPEIVILATDGEPNSCNDTTPSFEETMAAVTRGHDMNVTTYVISLADATGQFHDNLQQLANIGSGSNSATLYEPNSPQELADALSQLVGQAVSCDLELRGRISQGTECQGTVTINGDPLECNGRNGWELLDQNHIRLNGDACDRLLHESSALLEARFPCGIFMVD
jgi:hypothetical protein